ncbi:MAG: nickel-responsive transcriptional regulator NikR [Candidatus Tectimicrobiota bacterium]
MTELIRLSLSLPQPLLERLETLMQQQGYTNRSEFVRDMIRDHLVAHEWQSAQQETLGTVTLVYNHHIRQLSEKLIELQHHHYHAIMASTHVHLDHNLCAEVILVRASAAQIQELADHLRQQKGVLHATLSISSTGEHLA